MHRTGTIVWMRQDLRLRDNPALHAAAARRQAVIPLYIWSPEEEGAWPIGAAQRWWLHESLGELDRSLRALGSRLIIARGPALPTLLSVAAATGARAVHWSERYEPAAVAVAAQVAAGLSAAGIEVRRFNSAVLAEPATLLNGERRPYRIYSAFFRALLERADPGAPLPAPTRLRRPRTWPESVTRESLGLLPAGGWYSGMARCWSPGEAGAQWQFDRFLHTALPGYDQSRNTPSVRGTSRLSPHLHFGEISVREIWHALERAGRAPTFRSELGWREFGYHLLHHFPDTTDQPLRGEFARFPWKADRARLLAWQKGWTGLPLVDAGMRELWATGWMHNRVRMVAASFLVKNLMLPWQQGARWFWDTLVDADLASNTLNWQWVAGCGVDAAPFFRIFNPRAQAARFDPQGHYTRQWVPELSGKGARPYPEPIVDLGQSRAAALEAFQSLKASGAEAPRQPPGASVASN